MRKFIIIFFLIAVLSGSCSNISCPKQEVQDALTRFDVINLSFGERAQLFINDSEIQNPLQQLEGMLSDRASMDDLEVPLCLVQAKDLWLDYADVVIDAVTEVIKEGSSVKLRENFQNAIVFLQQYFDEASRVNDCVPNCK